MNIPDNEYWSDKRPYYILYQDKPFLKDIFAQIFSEFPDVGEIAYIGATTHRLTKDYTIDGEQCNARDIRKSNKENQLENNRKNDARNRAKISIIDTNEESQIREYANIPEIKEMNNMLFYKRIIKCLINEQVNGKCNNLCCIKDKVLMYDEYKESQDVFVKIGRLLCVAKKGLYGYNSAKYSKCNGNSTFARIYIRGSDRNVSKSYKSVSYIYLNIYIKEYK